MPAIVKRTRVVAFFWVSRLSRRFLGPGISLVRKNVKYRLVILTSSIAEPLDMVIRFLILFKRDEDFL